MLETIVLEPLPTILPINLNWNNPNALSALDLMRVFLSIRDHMTLSLFYKMSSATKRSEPEYHLNSFICFSGAHYYIFVAEKNNLG